MKRVYLDTSAYLKEFSPETGSETISKLFSACESGKVVLVTSQWTLSESIAAIDKKHRRVELSLEERFGSCNLAEQDNGISQKRQFNYCSD